MDAWTRSKNFKKIIEEARELQRVFSSDVPIVIEELFTAKSDSSSLIDELQETKVLKNGARKTELLFILPSSYIGSPRYMHQLYQDAMAIVRKFGKPDLFITFTCNPNWPEVKNSLNGTQTSADRSDLTTRVFHLKLKDLLKDIVDKQVCGKTLAYVYVVEFQKRGLPHAPFLLILDQNSKPMNPDNFDEYVSAEIPDPILLPEMHQIVTMHMIHGPCGKANPNSPCMEDGKCTKKFPKDFIEKNIQSLDGYRVYKRTEIGITVEKNGQKVDNRWVVPYNPHLLYEYGAHINVEISTHKLKLDPPTLAGGCDSDQWSAFTRQWKMYKTGMVITDNVLPTALFYCCDTNIRTDIMRDLQGDVASMIETDLLNVIKRLAVKEESTLVQRIKLNRMFLSPGSNIRTCLASLRGQVHSASIKPRAEK
ncbi:unnamed protein product [Mytilus coruscus]|uniref:Helitron helicase-like domain-containing protein n=1 Tax=Mytilus coruscus TaxID=42192 RepID=A0A6J8BAV8_MYTCO|nr:unnamed protein product [Mytilus coruscus]